jgi:hypothetical protein
MMSMMSYHLAAHTGLPEDDVGVSKHVGVLAIYKILFYIYIYVVQLLVRIINCTRYTVHTLK